MKWNNAFTIEWALMVGLMSVCINLIAPQINILDTLYNWVIPLICLIILLIASFSNSMGSSSGILWVLWVILFVLVLIPMLWFKTSNGIIVILLHALVCLLPVVWEGIFAFLWLPYYDRKLQEEVEAFNSSDAEEYEGLFTDTPTFMEVLNDEADAQPNFMFDKDKSWASVTES